MIYIIVIFGLATTIYSFLNYRSLLCPLNIFIPFFTFCTWLGSLCLFEKNQASNLTYILILISLVTYAFSFMLGTRLRLSKLMKEKWKDFENTQIDKRFVYSIAVVSLIYSVIKFSRAIPYFLQGYTLNAIRNEYWTGSNITISAMDDFFNITINGGIKIALMIIIAIEIIFEKKKDVKLFILITINILLSTFATGGRLALYDFVIILAFCFIAYRSFFDKKLIENNLHEKKNLKMVKRIVIILGILVFVLLVYITSQRQSNVEFFKAFYDDFSCFVPLMSYVIDMLKTSGDMTFGISSLDGLIIILNVLLSVLHLPQIKAANVINRYDATFFPVGGGNYANAYVSYIFYFYLDGRILGVIIGNIIFGVMSSKIYMSLRRRPGKRTLALYLFLVYIIFRTMIRWSFSQGAVFVALSILLFVYRKSKSNKIRIRIRK